MKSVLALRGENRIKLSVHISAPFTDCPSGTTRHSIMWTHSSVVSFSSHKSPSFGVSWIVRNNLWSVIEEVGRVYGRIKNRQVSRSLMASSMQQKYLSLHLALLIQVLVFFRASETLNSSGRWTKPGPTPIPYITGKKSNGKFPTSADSSRFSAVFQLRVPNKGSVFPAKFLVPVTFTTVRQRQKK